ncbi:MAG: NAD(P)/FAD-dependent oxidoreductase [Actinomycetota bacterium]
MSDRIVAADRGDWKQVVIIGAGFGGLAAAKALADAPVSVTIIDRRNHHLFQPLLYQVATAALNPSDIAQPVRRILAKQENCQPVLAEAHAVDTDGRTVSTSAGTIAYDYLIVATGATHAYFGNDHWADHAPGLKSVEDALDIRRRILLAFERAELTTDEEERRRLMTFVVVGAGPTGVEMAGAIREIATETLRRDFRRIDTTAGRVVMVEAGPAVLPAFTEKLQRSARRQLEQLGVEVMTDTRVTEITEDGVTIERTASAAGPESGTSTAADAGRSDHLAAATTIWAAGVAASPLGAAVAAETDRSGRAVVTSELSLADHPEVFVIGDVAAVTDDAGVSVPGVAPAAEQGGKHVAACIRADLDGADRPSFRYRDKGSMATIGRSKAVADLGPRLRFSGRAAWLLWGVVHVWSLIGFRSRLRTMGSWNWQYLTGQRGARLITGGRGRSGAPITDG